MDDDGPDVHAGFVRQRRSVVAVSLALVFVHTAGLSFTKLNLFGNEVGLADPRAASIALWLAWLYFLLRYYQYFRDVPEKGRGAYLSRLHDLVKAAAFQEYKQRSIAETEDLPLNAAPEFTQQRLDALERTGDLWHYKVLGYMSWQTPGVSNSRQQPERDIYIHGPRVTLAKVRAAIHVVLHTRFFTEFYLPFAVAAAPVVLVIWSRIRRSA